MLSAAKNEGSVLVGLLIALTVIVGVASSYILGKDDNEIEEVTETIFENQLGLPAGSIDFSPNSPE